MTANAPRKRVYTTVSLGNAEGRFQLLLDGKPARTPLRFPLETSSRALAEALVIEWDHQRDTIDPASMPMTRLLATAIDRVGPQRDAMIAELLRHVDSDVICYQAEAPQSLRARQETAWQPVLQWLEQVHGIPLTAGSGIMPRTQSPAVSTAMAAAIAALDRDRLTAFQAVAGASGSLALALALVHRRLNAAEVFAASFIDETYQMEQWGKDPLAEVRRETIARDIAAAEEFLRLATAP